MNNQESLPPGQREIDFFPRFGLSQYASRFKPDFGPLELLVSGDVKSKIVVSDIDLGSLPRIQQESDFHCVTTWSKRRLNWSGFRFIDFYEQIVLPHVEPHEDSTCVLLRSKDGFRARLPLQDLLSNDVLLADHLNGEPLSAKHGAPLRLVAPAHYGYKNAKHLKAIEFWKDDSNFRHPAFRFMDHPRGRVVFEERGNGVPGWFLRFLYRPVVKPYIRLFKHTMK